MNGDFKYVGHYETENNIPENVSLTKAAQGEQEGYSDATAHYQNRYDPSNSCDPYRPIDGAMQGAHAPVPSQAEIASAIRNGAEIKYAGMENGKVIFNVDGVGAIRTGFAHVSIDQDNATAAAVSNEDGSYCVTINSGEDQIKVDIDSNNHTTTFVNGEKVILDQVTGNKTEALANQALSDIHVQGNVSVHDGVLTVSGTRRHKFASDDSDEEDEKKEED